jgi:hypothetical protein
VNGNPVSMVDPLGLCGENAGGSSWYKDIGFSTGVNVLEGIGDTVIGSEIERLSSTVRGTTAPGTFGVASAPLRTTSIRPVVSGLKGLYKAGGGVVAAGAYAYDMYGDYKNYKGNDRIGAMVLTTTGTVVTVGVGAILGFASAPVWVSIGVGAGVGVGVSYGVNYVKQKIYGH